ncbi:MAG TPA: ASCH domain-containing protein [Ktedonobacterales bacterium]|nr:ASCH domain-containing protein [Ktedonobacterales bacterium]
MRVYERTLEFGWEGDNGLGARLIRQIIAGTKTATCSPLFSYTEEELTAVYASKGELVTVVDKEQRPHCTVCVIDVFQTPFGDPDQRLVSGEGDGDDVGKFQQDHRMDWKDWLAAEGYTLMDETILVVEVFELIDVAP